MSDKDITQEEEFPVRDYISEEPRNGFPQGPPDPEESKRHPVLRILEWVQQEQDYKRPPIRRSPPPSDTDDLLAGVEVEIERPYDRSEEVYVFCVNHDFPGLCAYLHAKWTSIGILLKADERIVEYLNRAHRRDPRARYGSTQFYGSVSRFLEDLDQAGCMEEDVWALENGIISLVRYNKYWIRNYRVPTSTEIGGVGVEAPPEELEPLVNQLTTFQLSASRLHQVYQDWVRAG